MATIDFNNYKLTNKLDKFFFVEEKHIKDYKIDIRKLIEQMSFFKDISNDFKVSFNELFDIVNYLNFPIRDLFEFSVYKTNSLMLIKKDGVYREKKKWSFGHQYMEKEYHDVYLRQNEYIHLWYNRVVMVFVEDKYSHIFSHKLFNEVVRKYPKDFEIKPHLKIKDITYNNDYSELTLNDIAELIHNPKEKNKKILKSKFQFYGYGDSVFYLSLGEVEVHNHNYPISLVIPYTTLVEKNWEALEEYMIHGIIKPNANFELGKDSNNWFHGKQKDNPYWEVYKKEIQTLKKLILA